MLFFYLRKSSCDSVSSLLRFASFELDLANRELRKSGALVKLPPQPMTLLALLAENAGELVSREQIFREILGRSDFCRFGS